MISEVIKRNNSKVKFDKSKISEAILRAMKYGSGRIDEEIANRIADEIAVISKDKELTIKEIEELVFNKLVRFKHEDTAKAYEGYRAIQEFKRNRNTTDETILDLVSSTNEEVMKENSNKNAQIASTQRDLIAGEVSKDIARRKLIPAHIVQAHDKGVIHYHDLDYAISPIFNCCLINLEDMLDNGTVINEKMVETPKSFETACTVATQIIAQVASNQYGGQSITVRHLAPYLRKNYEREYNYFLKKYGYESIAKEEAENRRRKALKDGVQTIRYQLSTLMTVNG